MNTIEIISVHDELFTELVTIGNSKIKSKTINGNEYLVSEKQPKNFRIELRAKIPIDYLHENEYKDLSHEIQENIINKLYGKLSFSAQEIYMLSYIFHLLLSNDSNLVEVDFNYIHSKIRKKVLKKDYKIEESTLRAYQRALDNLQSKIIHIEVAENCIKKYGSSFTSPLLEKLEDYYCLGNFGKLIKIRGRYSMNIVPISSYQYAFKQVSKFIICHEIARCIFITTTKNWYYYKINLSTLVKKIPRFNKSGIGIRNAKYSLNRFFKNTVDILEEYKKLKVIKDYVVLPVGSEVSYIRTQFIIYLEKVTLENTG